ncbi:hypothetical protein BGZ73_009017 [Actinomortierella ambigua]|nr:hypothetical protein BGZ73_009017 [Actinomortierella ambigua]
MSDKLQEKFALVQQMKREKELKEAKARESQPLDIFALAGVTLPPSSGLNHTIRHNSSAPTNQGTVKRPRKDGKSSVPSTPMRRTSSSAGSTSSVSLSEMMAVDTNTSTGDKKLKRSSMAPNMSMDQDDEDEEAEVLESGSVAASPEHAAQHGRQASTGSATTLPPTVASSAAATPTTDLPSAASSATPPTPIPSPRSAAESGLRRRESTDSTGSAGSSRRPTETVKDMTRNVHSRAGSAEDLDEEMIVDMYGRSVPRSRHHSSDEGSDSDTDHRHPRRRRRVDRYEDDEYDSGRYRPSYSRHHYHRYDSRSRSRSRPYYRHRGGDRRRRRDDRDDRRSDDEQSHRPAEDQDPYAAASSYLDTAFYPTKIYVGNLPSSVSLTSLRTAFAPFGDIEDMNLVEGKDFGFVTFKEPSAAQEALAKMNGAVIDGTYIRVNRAKIPERNRRGFAGVAWMDEDGELARMEEEQHQQAAAIAAGVLNPAAWAGHDSMSSRSSPAAGGGSGGGGMAREAGHRSGYSSAAEGSNSRSSGGSASSSSTAGTFSGAAARTPHSLPSRPRSPKLPPKPTGDAVFPPAGIDPRAATSVRGGRRQILSYDDL